MLLHGTLRVQCRRKSICKYQSDSRLTTSLLIRTRFLSVSSTFTSTTLIFTNTILLHVQCGGRKTSPRARNQCCYYFLFERVCAWDLLSCVWPPWKFNIFIEVFGLSLQMVLMFWIGFWKCFAASTLWFRKPPWNLCSKQHRWRAFITRNTCPVHYLAVVYHKCF